MNYFEMTDEYCFRTDESISVTQHRQRKVDYYNALSFKPERAYDSLHEEVSAMERFVIANNWPEWFTDYDFYDDAKAIFANVTDANVLRLIGQRVYRKRHSTDDLRELYYFMMNVSALSVSCLTQAYTGAAISSAWDGIGEWRS